MSLYPGLLPMTPAPRSVPSQGGLRLILAGTAYLVAIALLQLATVGYTALTGSSGVSSAMMDTRDVVALFGWVGLMISGVAVIIVPNHFRVNLRPASLPTVHLVAANVGLGLLLGGGILGVGAAVAAGLAIVSVSFLVFALALVVTIAPFVRRQEPTLPARPLRAPAEPVPLPSGT